MGKVTGFLEIERHDRKYTPVTERVKHFNEFAKGKKMWGFGVIGLPLALAHNAITSSQAKAANRGRTAAGQVRFEWPVSVLLEDATKAIATLGIPVGDHLIAVENTPARHNMVVCTLCSCYPWDVLGLPPVWYKSAPYRSRAVMDPRGVLADFGVTLPKDTEVRVWDSPAETRALMSICFSQSRARST